MQHDFLIRGHRFSCETPLVRNFFLGSILFLSIISPARAFGRRSGALVSAPGPKMGRRAAHRERQIGWDGIWRHRKRAYPTE